MLLLYLKQALIKLLPELFLLSIWQFSDSKGQLLFQSLNNDYWFGSSMAVGEFTYMDISEPAHQKLLVQVNFSIN